MFNYNSPVVQNNNLGGIQNPPSTYFANNGNMIGIGNVGYGNTYPITGGYYNNNYTIYNPYLIEQQKRAQEAQRMEFMRQSADTMKMVSRKVNKALGNEITDERLRELYDPEELRTTPEELDIQNNNRLRYVDQFNNYQSYEYQNPLYTAMGRVQEENQKKLPVDMGLYEFLSVGGEMIFDQIKKDALNQRKAVNELYNRNDYKQLIEARSKSNNFAPTFNPNASTDDMSISLPEHLKNEYQRRKELFMEAIINRGGVSHG